MRGYLIVGLLLLGASGVGACSADVVSDGTLAESVEQDGCDCRFTGCAEGQACVPCWGGYACLPEGAACFGGPGGGDDGSGFRGDGSGDAQSGGDSFGPVEQGGPGGDGGDDGSCGDGGDDDPPPDDCRSTGCDEGQYCTFCWVGYACIPDGAVC
ncbi:MAG: hypothetical protein IT379_15190 [Deltaproteobacteria bacterium]|nr:hypothetical protein [Deltaproteobacteria bacterium]